MLTRMLARLLALMIAIAPLQGARATQNELIPPTAGVYTGVQFSQLLGDAFRSLASCNKGASAPANVSGAVVDGLCWIDDSVTPWLLKLHASGVWVTLGAIDQTNGLWAGAVGGGTADLASAATVDLGSVPQANITITGTVTVTSFGSSAPTGAIKFIRFDGALTLTHSANVKVPGAYSLTTAADDRAIVRHLGLGAWEITQYTRASGVPIDVSAVGKIEYGMFADAPAQHLFAYGQALTRTSYPAYLAKVTRAQNATRVSGNATLTSVSDTSALGAGMPVEGTGINAGCTISSVTSSTIVLNSSACVTSSGTSTATVFLTGYGSGGSATTVGAPDCRGNLVAGLDTLNGSAAGRITSAGSGIVGTQANAAGGAQTVLVLRTHLEAGINLTPNTASQILSHTSAGAPTVAPNSGSGSTPYTPGGSPSYASAQFIGMDTHTVNFPTYGLGGSGTPLNKMPPTLMAQCVVRVSP